MTAIISTLESPPRIAARLTLAGRVQGIGVRPAIARCAQRLSLTGYVGNSPAGVEIHVEGLAADVKRFEHELRGQLPAAAEVSSLRSTRVEPAGCETFLVAQAADLPSSSAAPSTPATLSTSVPADMAICRECSSEVQSAADRRYGYPFTSCTNCGPRYSIIARMPYERSHTSMSEFPLCDACRGEYQSAADRRFHAQANACPRCGPQVWLRDVDHVIARGQDAVRAAATAIRDGRIVALRGLGGYQLLVDATSQEAVERLRRRKHRRGKPLAVMVASVEEALRLACLDEDERRLLCSPAAPIVVADLRGDARLAASVSEDLPTVGLMLPTTPLHAMLLNFVQRPLVCTSGNVEDEPLVYELDAASEQLQGVADLWLEHDRPILRPIDDSVVRVMAGRAVTIRLARGYAPLPLDLRCEAPLLALGGHHKTSIALSNGAQAVLGPHVGDLDSIASRQRYAEQVDALSDLYGIDTCQLACDLHPEYFTTQWAENRWPAIERVQHHHAHIAAGMLEHGWLDRQVLGVSFDGTGYGMDGTIWGGEFLLSTATGFARVGHLRPFALPGGEQAVRQPWRVATGLVRDAAGNDEAARLGFQTGDAESLLPLLRRPNLSPVTTSAGRLFDGVAALVLGVEECCFEGQAAMFLEAACDRSDVGRYDIPIQNGVPRQLDWRPLVKRILCDRAVSVSPGAMAMRFHRGLADAIAEFCRSYGNLPIVLGGGVFQNRVLVELLAERFADTSQMFGLPGRIPPNDGGLAAGQLAVAAALIRQRRTSSCA
jgi:hydrogenase maturation protein HypF